MKFSSTFLVCILDLIQPISTALSTASYPSGVDTLFIVSRTVFWIAFPSEKNCSNDVDVKSAQFMSAYIQMHLTTLPGGSYQQGRAEPIS